MIQIDRKHKFAINENEFKPKVIKEFETLELFEDLGEFERIVGLIKELSFLELDLVSYKTTHGGFIPIQSSTSYKNVLLCQTEDIHLNNIITNIDSMNIQNISMVNSSADLNGILYGENINNTFSSTICITKSELNFPYKYILSSSDYKVYVNSESHEKFKTHFSYCIKDNILDFDNLIHLTMIVKNAGDTFERVLLENLPYIDRWTILDTGSTDNTIETIKRILVGKKPGNLYEEPFINFRESRNRCLDLTGNSCKFTVMLDDTYILRKNFREFLQTVRSDQFSDSFSLFIKSNDVEYTSNRVIKSVRNIRYIYRIHEVIDTKNNKNVCIPNQFASIEDIQSDYMMKRTESRKRYDLDLLFEELRDDPEDPRHLYYIAQTYRMLDEYENAFEYFLKRVNHPKSGFDQEVYDSYFEAARLARYELNKPWELCEDLYLKAHSIDPSRPDSMYFIGVHHYFENNHKVAYEYFKKGLEIGYPSEGKISGRPSISFHFLPKFLIELSYMFEDYQSGYKSCEIFINSNPKDSYTHTAKSYLDIYKCLLLMETTPLNQTIPNKPWFCFMVDGGFNDWTGRNIETTGVGGSETCIIELSNYIQSSGQYNVIVFCRCQNRDVYKGVIYEPLINYFKFLRENYVEVCISSRYSEYVPVALKSGVPKVYAMSHDTNFTGNVIPTPTNFKGVICLSEWHSNLFKYQFPSLQDKTFIFGYGIDTDKFKPSQKIPYKFIYSSFANRGLVPLLQMWPYIVEKYPTASLDIYCDLENSWMNKYHKNDVESVKKLLSLYGYMNIRNHGWVDKKTLADSWSTAHVWFYPCYFDETFCLTALEAAATKTLAITSKSSALQNNVGQRGIMIEGDPRTIEWQQTALSNLFFILDNKNIQEFLVEKNYNWAVNLTWKNRTDDFLNLIHLSEIVNINNEKDIISLSGKKLHNVIYNGDTFSELLLCWFALEKNGFLTTNITPNTSQFFDKIDNKTYSFEKKDSKVVIKKL